MTGSGKPEPRDQHAVPASAAEISIAATAYHLPGEPVSVEDWCASAGQGEDKLRSLRAHGARQVHFAAGAPIEQLVFAAVEPLADRGLLDGRSIGLVVFAHTTQFSVPKPPRNITAMVMRRFGLSRAYGFSVSEQNCVSLFTAVRMARAALTRSPGLEAALVICGDLITDERHREVDGVGLFSDGAGALLLVRGGARNRLVDLATLSDGRFATRIFSDKDPKRKLLETQALFLGTEQILGQVLARNGFAIGDVGLLLPHNLDLTLWRKISRFLQLDHGLIYGKNIGLKGHCFCADLVINLCDLDEDEDCRIADGTPFVGLSRGYGWNYGAMLLQR